MWKRIQYEGWADAVPYIAFFLTFGVFLLLVIRAILMRRAHVRHMAHLPLEDTPPPEPSASEPETSGTRPEPSTEDE